MPDLLRTADLLDSFGISAAYADDSLRSSNIYTFSSVPISPIGFAATLPTIDCALLNPASLLVTYRLPMDED
jgi:hypothetical protein